MEERRQQSWWDHVTALPDTDRTEPWEPHPHGRGGGDGHERPEETDPDQSSGDRQFERAGQCGARSRQHDEWKSEEETGKHQATDVRRPRDCDERRREDWPLVAERVHRERGASNPGEQDGSRRGEDDPDRPELPTRTEQSTPDHHHGEQQEVESSRVPARPQDAPLGDASNRLGNTAWNPDRSNRVGERRSRAADVESGAFGGRGLAGIAADGVGEPEPGRLPLDEEDADDANQETPAPDGDRAGRRTTDWTPEDREVHEPPDGEDCERLLADTAELGKRHEQVAPHGEEGGDGSEDGLVAGDEG